MIKDKIEEDMLVEYSNDENALLDILRQACKKIAPVWPLKNFVAVNPYLGLSNQKFEDAAQQLATAGGIEMTLPISFYRNKISEGKIKTEDIAVALAKKSFGNPVCVHEFISSLDISNDQGQNNSTIDTLIDVASLYTKKDWGRFVTSRISIWAASYFDNGQAVWVVANQRSGLFSSWKIEAELDLTPEIIGLKSFRKKVMALPDQPLKAVQAALKILEVPSDGISIYLHRLLLRVGGWSAYAARIDWDSELYRGKDGKEIEFLAILICWEACILQCLDCPELHFKWEEAKNILTAVNIQKVISPDLAQKLILQDAFDVAAQREIIQKFQTQKHRENIGLTQNKAQAIFCIDVRSEVFRRNLELVDPEIETIGFAGFFAFPINYIPVGHKTGKAQCPVLLQTGPAILEQIGDKETNLRAYSSRVHNYQVQQIWKSFKSGAITCFSFVSPIGLSYLPKLFTDSFGLTRPVPHPDKADLKGKFLKNKHVSLEVSTYGDISVGIPVDQRIQMAKNALKAMSLTENFARFILIVGHASTTVNNPHATGLDCGACGGHSGESNARVAAAVLNDKDVREYLQVENIFIPDSTLFLACLHDTTLDELNIFNEHEIPENRKEELDDLKKSITQAGHASRTERALRMSIKGNIDTAISYRSKDWSQTRPEWGLAGCSSLIIAPRERTKGINLGGRSFLHSYIWKKDEGFSVLELIMTAPMVVATWISLQYYASTVDNKTFGSGNKTLHNVTAGVGVLEGFSGDLRVGLPLQSIHDGESYQHEPLRLNVIIEAPIKAMNTVLEKNLSIRNLCDNGWLHLLAMNDQGKISYRYTGNLNWEEVLTK